MILDEAGAAGYPVCLSYDVDPEDWTDPGTAATRSGAAAATAGSIVSLHFGHPGTVQALPDILDDLAARGLQAVSSSTLLASGARSSGAADVALFGWILPTRLEAETAGRRIHQADQDVDLAHHLLHRRVGYRPRR